MFRRQLFQLQLQHQFPFPQLDLLMQLFIDTPIPFHRGLPRGLPHDFSVCRRGNMGA